MAKEPEVTTTLDSSKRYVYKMTKAGENELMGYLYYRETLYWLDRGWTLKLVS